MEATAELDALMAELREALPAAEAATEEVGRIKNAIRSALGDHSGAHGDGWRLSFKRGKDRRQTAWKALAGSYRKALEDVDDKYPGFIADLIGVQPGTPIGDTLDEVERMHTTTSDGTRPLLPTWTQERDQGWT